MFDALVEGFRPYRTAEIRWQCGRGGREQLVNRPPCVRPRAASWPWQTDAMRSVRKPPILARAHQHFDRTRFIGKILVDIAFTVRYHGHARSSHGRKVSSA